MRALQFSRSGPVSNLRLVDLPDPQPDEHTAIAKLAAASISPGDVKNVEGKMDNTTLPRVPGRDHAGTVIRGPEYWMGAEVWGTGGEIGYTIDGNHAELVSVPGRKPRTLSLQQAASAGLTYLAAWMGLIEYAQITGGETLLIVGAWGGVGGDAAQIGRWRGARVIAVDRHALRADAPAAPAVDEFFLLGTKTFDTIARAATARRGTEVVFDTVGGPMFEPALKALAPCGRQPVIASPGDRRVSFDLINFYHNESRLLGVDTRARNAIAWAKHLDALGPFFKQGIFQVPQIERILALADRVADYQEVTSGQPRERLALAS
jgi:NADPH2:quinone reductase